MLIEPRQNDRSSSAGDDLGRQREILWPLQISLQLVTLACGKQTVAFAKPR